MDSVYVYGLFSVSQGWIITYQVTEHKVSSTSTVNVLDRVCIV